jgi:protein O-GlcNAc transferase
MIFRMNPDFDTIEKAVQIHLSGKLDEASAMYRQILSREPANSEALHLLGVIAYQRNDYREAEALISRAIAINKRVAEYRNNLGNVYMAQKILDKAEECYIKALKLNPKYADVRNNLANVLRERGRLEEAAGEYRKAVKLDPERPEIHNNLGMVLDALGRSAEAVEAYQEAIRLKPDFCEAYCNLAAAFKNQGKLLEALASCAKALELDPSHARSLLNLGNAYSQLGQIDKGVVCFRKALLSDPNLSEAHLNLGHALREEGNKEEAAAHFQQAISLNPVSLPARLGDCIGQIPLLHDSIEEITQTRENYRTRLEALRREIERLDPRSLSRAGMLVGNCQPFFLAYQGQNDRELQSLYGSMMVRIQSACHPSWSRKRSLPASKPGEPLRIGIVSGFYFLHSNWKIPIKGWVENLNRRGFQLFGYYTGRVTDNQTELARRSFHQFVENLSSFEQWCDRICKDQLHVLIFPEVGMDPLTVRLACLRLAPIQCASWGHPDTSGLPTMDYYLSSDLMEPPDADDHYAERLVRLPNLSIYYEPPPIPPARADRGYFGLREDAVVFLCSQSLFKYLPQFDEIFPRIAAEIGRCQFAFLNFVKSPQLGERFKRRLEKSFRRFGLKGDDYVTLLPHLDPPHYRALNQTADVFLDSIGWSGCNSTLEALACDLPIVTMPGKLMRARHTHAILKMMNCSETEGQTIEDYVAIAKKLGTDPEYRRHMSEEISRLKHLAYNDKACIHGLEEFLKKAVSDF